MGVQHGETARPELLVVGAGLAGCEAAWQAAARGLDVTLVEMKPLRRSPAHVSDGFGELVCSNSLRSADLGNAVGLLKEEMRRLGSLVMRAADATAVPAGRALAVDRSAFERELGEAVEAHPHIAIRHEVVEKLPDPAAAPLAVLATGPLTAPELAGDLQAAIGSDSLYFYDAISPTVYADSIDTDVVFRASRYEDGEGDYLNVPLDRAQYEGFVDALLEAETVPLHAFEAALYFEGCLPIEEMARRGRETLAHGPMKPVGLVDPRTGRRPHAVVQLRQEDHPGVLYNLVGFQTKLRIGEQRRLLRSLPGLSEAVFARYGSVHRNTYLNAPEQLTDTLELRARPGLYVAGQMAGVEGYVESAALGFVAGVNASRAAHGLGPLRPPEESAHGALLRHLRDGNPRHFQPMNVNFGLFPPLTEPLRPPQGERRGRGRNRRRERHLALSERALASLAGYVRTVGPADPAGGAT